MKRFSISLLMVGVSTIFLGAGITPPGGQSFQLKNPAGDLVAYADSSGNLKLTGYVTEHASGGELTSDGSDFVVKNSAGSVVARFDAATGNLYLKESLIEYGAGGQYAYASGTGACGNCSSNCPTNYTPADETGTSRVAFLIKNASGDDVGWIDQTGAMVVKGKVTEGTLGANPDRNIRLAIWKNGASGHIELKQIATGNGSTTQIPSSPIDVDISTCSSGSPCYYYFDAQWGFEKNEFSVKKLSGSVTTVNLKIVRLSDTSAVLYGCNPAGPSCTQASWDFSNFAVSTNAFTLALDYQVSSTLDKFNSGSDFNCAVK